MNVIVSERNRKAERCVSARVWRVVRVKEEGCESMINAALPLYVSERREDRGEPNSISILCVLLEETAVPLYRCSTAFQITE